MPRGPFFSIWLLSDDGDQPSTMTKVHRDSGSLVLAVHLTPTWLSTLRDAFPDSEDTRLGGGQELWDAQSPYVKAFKAF